MGHWKRSLITDVAYRLTNVSGFKRSVLRWEPSTGPANNNSASINGGGLYRSERRAHVGEIAYHPFTILKGLDGNICHPNNSITIHA